MDPTSDCATEPSPTRNDETEPVWESNSTSLTYPSALPETVLASMPVHMMQRSQLMPRRLRARSS